MSKDKHIAAKYCTLCNYVYPRWDAKFCEECGKPLSIKCTDCDKIISEYYPYCPFSGKEFNHYHDPE
ncbi:zinc ribbon domain-containing protein [Thermodesulfobacteriota bacterium]